MAQAGLVQAKWTDRILEEVFTNLAINRPDLDPARLARTRELMNRSVRDCLVHGYEPIEAGLTLPDPDDRHVLAAAIKAKAQVLVTFNLRDFPASALQSWDIDAKTADDFILDQLDLDPEAVYASVQRIADSRHHPPATVNQVLDRLERDGLVSSVAALRA